MAKYVDFGDFEGFNDGDDVFSPFPIGEWYFASATPYTGVVDQEDGAGSRDGIDELRVPMVDVCAEVLVEDEGNSIFIRGVVAEEAVGVGCVFDGNVLCLRGSVGRHLIRSKVILDVD